MPNLHPEKIGRPAVYWALYDFGYSIFAFVIFARYLGDWIINDLGHPDWYYTTAQAGAALLLFITMPIAGVIADITGRHKPMLITFTLVATFTGAMLGVLDVDIGIFGVFPILALGAVSAAATGLTYGQFDPMLAIVAPKRQWSLMSGIAVGAGYLGIIAWLVWLADLIVGDGSDQSVRAAFAPAALIFVLCSLPLFFRVKERAHGDRDLRLLARAQGLIPVTASRMRSTIKRIRQQKGVPRFLLGRLMYADAIGTVQVYAIVYMSRVGGFGEREKNLATLVVVIFGALGALFAGWIARKAGPRRTLLAIMPLFCIGIVIVAGSGKAWAIWLLAPIVGISLGTIYTVDRVFMLALTPAHLRGELFGFFNLIGRAGQALGPLVLWGGVIWVLHDKTEWLSILDASRVAMGLLSVSALVGLIIIWPLRDNYVSQNTTVVSTEISKRSRTLS